MRMQSKPVRARLHLQSGMSLLETLIAISLLLIVSVGIMSMATIAISTTENQGHLMARTTEYAQDKMEQLISLAYGDGDCPTFCPPHATDTTVFPVVFPGGMGLAVGGSSNPNSPVVGYVDYLDVSGNPLAYTGGTPPANWFYVRVWQISTPTGTTNLKQITVTAKTRSSVGSPNAGALPQATISTLKTNPF